MNDQDLTLALRQFNVISSGDQTFTKEQYSTAFALQGDIKAGDTDKTVIMPVEAEEVLGAVATGIVIEDTTSPQAETGQIETGEDITPEKNIENKISNDVELDVNVDLPETESGETDSRENETMSESEL